MRSAVNLRRLRQSAHDLVRAEPLPIHRLPEALREHRQLSGDEAEQILAAARSEQAVGSFLPPISSR